MYLQTALHISAHIGCPKNIQTLLNYNANLMLQDSNGFTALDIALNEENTICSKLLKDALGNFIIEFLLEKNYCFQQLFCQNHLWGCFSTMYLLGSLGDVMGFRFSNK